MAGIFTRKAISNIMADENLTPEERTDQIFALHGRAIDDGFTTKAAAEASRQQAVEEALKNAPKPNAKDSEEYKTLSAEFEGYKARQQARTSDEFKDIKPKFFDAVYDKLDRAENAAPIAEQISKIKQDYEEYFNKTEPQQTPTMPIENKPQFGAPTQGSAPKGDKGQSFGDYWGFKPRKDD